MQRHEVAVVHAVAERGQPRAVAPGPAADVGDDARRSRQVAGDDLLRPGELQRAGATVEPVALLAELVVGVQRRSLVGSHTQSVTHCAYSGDGLVHQRAQLGGRIEGEAAIPLRAGGLAVAGICRDHGQEAVRIGVRGSASTALASCSRAAVTAASRSSSLAPADALNSRNPE